MPYLVIVIVGLGFRFVVHVIELLAACAQPSSVDDAAKRSISGRGAFNFRTGKFDDGADPSGIYDLE